MLSELLPSTASQLHRHRTILTCLCSAALSGPSTLGISHRLHVAYKPPTLHLSPDLHSHAGPFLLPNLPFPIPSIHPSELAQGQRGKHRLGPRIWAAFWLLEHILTGYVTTGRDVATCHCLGPVCSHRGALRALRGQGLCVSCPRLQSQQPAQCPTSNPRQLGILHRPGCVGTQGRNDMEQSLPQQGAHILVNEADNKQYNDKVRAVGKTILRKSF